MKALILADEINQFHWAMLKSVLLVLSILPLSQGALHLWQSTEGSSQIVVGFFAASLLSTLLVLSFWSALKATAAKLQQHETAFEHAVVQAYRYLPMLSLAGMLAYLASQI
jgi:predicted membrane channel-forming protein YqfA (hemolysin III family)